MPATNLVRAMSPDNVEVGTAVGSASAVKERRRKIFTGGNASKRHRDRVNIEFQNLAQLLPFPESVIAKLDKSSILRLAVSYIRAKSFFKGLSLFENDFKGFDSVTDVVSDDEKSPVEPLREGTGVLSDIFSQALDGFLLVVTEDMRVLFVSDSVRDYLGYCQAGIIHENFLQFVNPADHSIVHNAISYTASELDQMKTGDHKKSGQRIGQGVQQKLGSSARVLPRRFLCRMKCAFSCSSRFYTAYRTFSFSGHLRRSTIQEGQEQRTVNTLIVFGVPTTAAKCSSIDVVSEGWDEQEPVPSDSEMTNFMRFSSGFRIEPTLRPHVAPIPVSVVDSDMPSGSFISRLPHRSHPTTPTVPTGYPVDRLPGYPCVPFYPVAGALPAFLAPKYGSGGAPAYDPRFGDCSDDSGCSPASSPDLLWKPRRNVAFAERLSLRAAGRSPEVCDPGPTFRFDSEIAGTCQSVRNSDIPRFASSENLIEDLYYRYRPKSSPTSEESSPVCAARNFSPTCDKKTKTASDDIFAGANVLMTLKNARTSPSTSPGPKLAPSSTVAGDKRRHESDGESSDLVAKRQKLGSSFNITALLGLDDSPSGSGAGVQEEAARSSRKIADGSDDRAKQNAACMTALAPSVNLFSAPVTFSSALGSCFSWPNGSDFQQVSEWPYYHEDACRRTAVGTGLGASNLVSSLHVKSLVSKS